MVMMHNMAVGDANPKPMIFAIMRNGHEVIRGAMMDIRRLLDGDCDYTTAKHEWELLSRWQNLHAAMEEGCGRPNQGPIGFFNVLNKHCDNVATDKGLFTYHEELHKLEQAVDEAFRIGGWYSGHGNNNNKIKMDAIRYAFSEYHRANEEHLKYEESIMMPQVQKLFKEGHDMKKIMKEEMIACVRHDMEFFIKYACGTLQNHSQTMPRFRVMGHALWAIADNDTEWQSWDEWIRQAVSPINYTALEAVLPQ